MRAAQLSLANSSSKKPDDAKLLPKDVPSDGAEQRSAVAIGAMRCMLARAVARMRSRSQRCPGQTDETRISLIRSHFAAALPARLPRAEYSSHVRVSGVLSNSVIQGLEGVRVSLRVLVVDDDLSVRVSLVRVLCARGLQAVGAGNGAEALAKALESPPEVIVMDLMMPIQSGTDAARAIRREPALSNVPIIALSASPQLVIDGEPLFESVLAKPCRLDHLIDTIARAARR